MKRLIGTIAGPIAGAFAVWAGPLLLLGAATPAAAHTCTHVCKPGHHAKPAAKAHKAAQKPARRQHARPRHAAPRTEHYSAGGMNTYGSQRQSGYGYAAPGYGVSYGPGYGYTHEANREGGYARGYSTYDVQTYEYDSGWVPGTAAVMPQGYGAQGYGAQGYGAQGYGAQGYSSSYDSGWTRPSMTPCPGAVACLPAGHPPVNHPPMSYGQPYGAGYGGNGVSVGPEVFYGGLAGGVSGPESFGGYGGGGGGGGGVVVLGSTAGGASAFSGARAAAFASASASAKSRGYSRGGYGKGGKGGKGH